MITRGLGTTTLLTRGLGQISQIFTRVQNIPMILYITKTIAQVLKL